MLGCDGCSNYQHAGCFADEDGVNDPGVHVFCVECSVVCLACKGRHSTASNPLIKCDASGCDRAQHAKCCDPPLSRAPAGFLESVDADAHAAGELEFGAFYAETGAAPGTAPDDLLRGGV